MKPPQAKMPGKRRRWLIVLFVPMSLFSWWHWPRGDERFVGKWNWHDPGVSRPTGTLSAYKTGLGHVDEWTSSASATYV
jgi:hypothetical protein